MRQECCGGRACWQSWRSMSWVLMGDFARRRSAGGRHDRAVPSQHYFCFCLGPGTSWHGGCPVHCRMFSGIPGLHPLMLGTPLPRVPAKNHLQPLQDVSGGQSCPLLRISVGRRTAHTKLQMWKHLMLWVWLRCSLWMWEEVVH
jgi:hypothetical protein